MQPCPCLGFKVICQLTLEIIKFCGDVTGQNYIQVKILTYIDSQ